MDIAGLIPVPDPIPVHWIWFQLLLTVTFFLHIVVMNVMLGLALITLVNQVKKQGDLTLCRDISKKLPYSIAFAVNFGVAPLLFVQVLYGHFIYTSSILMGAFWLSIIGLLITAYYLTYISTYNFDRMGSIRVAVSACIALLLLLIGFFFVNNMTMMQHPESWVRYFESRRGLLLNLADPTLWPRYLHFVLSAVAVGGLSIALLGEYQRRRGQAWATERIRQGTAWYGYATIANFGAGFWFLGALPEHTRDLATLPGILFAIALLLGIIAGAYSVITALSQRVMPSLYALLIALVTMIIARDCTRAGYLRDYFTPGDLQVVPQYSPFLLFLLFFAGGLVLIGWMLRLAMKPSVNGEVHS